MALIALALLSGCAVGPDFVPAADPPVTGYTPGRMQTRTVAAGVPGGASQRLILGRDVPGEWWALFHSRALKSLVEQSLRNNPDLQAAQAALRVAAYNTAAQRGAFFPSVDAGFSATRQKVAADITGEVPEPRHFNVFTAQVSASYTPDVFGANRRAVESLEALEEVQRFQLEAAYLTLTSNLALAAIQEASLRGQIAATQQIIKIATDLLDLLRRQRGVGQIAEADVVQQEAALAQIQQTLPPLQRQLQQQRHLLTALAGRFPSQEVSERFELGMLQLPETLPVSLPSHLVRQRPDIRAAEANVASASALVGVAVANRLPNITLSANVGSTAFDITKLFSPGTGFWTLAGAIVQPVFRGGALMNRELAARETLNQTEAQYRSTVIVAFQNVADALSAVQMDAVALQKAVDAERAAARSLSIVRQRLELGDVNYLAVLNAQQTYQQALISVVLAKANRYADTVALFFALGGGWWNRQDVAPVQPVPASFFIFQ
jgi:NodT family efflux transporter outer membrane factor (OMF) lipoprotein